MKKTTRMSEQNRRNFRNGLTAAGLSLFFVCSGASALPAFADVLEVPAEPALAVQEPAELTSVQHAPEQKDSAETELLSENMKEATLQEGPGFYVIGGSGTGETDALISESPEFVEAVSKEGAATEIQEAGQQSAKGQQVAQFALQFVGNPYRYGGTSLTNGADCSGFIMSVYQNFGVSLPHSSAALASVGRGMGANLANALPGDIICYSGHAGIYIGNGQIVHASTERTGIKVSQADYKPVRSIRRIF